MEDRWFVKKLFGKFFFPSLLCTIALAIGALVDSLYIGSTLGEAGLFVLGAASPVYMLYNMISLGISEGGAIHFSAAMSEGREKDAARIFTSVITADFVLVALVSACGLLFTPQIAQLLGCAENTAEYPEMLRYLRLLFLVTPVLFMQAPLNYFVHSDNAPKRAAISLVAGGVTDCVVGYILIVHLGLGVCGSIWSTLAGAVVMELICLGHLFSKRGSLKFNKLVRPAVKPAVKSVYTGFSSATQYIYQFVILLSFNRILLRIAGTAGVAIFDIAVNVNGLVTSVVDAIIMAMIPLISTFYGERNENATQACLKISSATGIVFTTLFGGLVAVFAAPYCAFSGLSGTALSDGAAALQIMMASMAFTAANSILVAYFQSTESEKMSYVISFLRGIALLLPFGFLLAQFGFTAFWWCYTLTEGVSLAVSLLFLAVKRKKRKTADGKNRDSVFSETFVGSSEKISDICEHLQLFLEESGASPQKAYFVTLAVDETCRLIAENGGKLTLQLTLVKEENDYVLHIRDNAAGRFNPFEVDENDECGLGLKLVKKQATDFYYRQFVGFNTLTVIFGGK